MTASFLYLFICLIAGIALIVLLTTKYKVPPFFALILSAVLVGLSVQMPIGLMINTIKAGFGNILKLLGLVIVLGTTLGVMLEYTGSINGTYFNYYSLSPFKIYLICTF
ncbi:hypothetical protein [Mucilaginibacter sp.]|uniref:GntT/GntP/DsdX family permease n=1 Tax=Mucilaginibacter sp. TaxID=1882438 RepID=UPI0028513F5C|nr:hypothetical protein [Mucilaginibacter sp.]MDR3693738.1 hypothetical protein [Mucilaginibacter sp.]